MQTQHTLQSAGLHGLLLASTGAAEAPVDAGIADLLAILQGEPAKTLPVAQQRAGTPPVKIIEVCKAAPSKSIQEQGIDTLLGLIRNRHPLHLRFSSGKDSTSCAVLMIEAVRRAVAEGITTTHYIPGECPKSSLPDT